MRSSRVYDYAMLTCCVHDENYSSMISYELDSCLHETFKLSSISPCIIQLVSQFTFECCWYDRQSSGKSSVLESVVGKDFLPRGSGMVVTLRHIAVEFSATFYFLMFGKVNVLV